MEKRNVNGTEQAQIVVRPDIQPLLGEFTFKDFFNLQGRTEKDHPATDRSTSEVTIKGKKFFLKRHNGVGWEEILKNVCSFKRPITSAYNEYWALQHLPEMGIPTAPFAAYGEKGKSPASKQSFVMSETLTDTETLESFVPQFFCPFLSSQKIRVKRALVTRIADIARRLHDHGFIHQDFYLCHFRIDISPGETNLTPENLKLYVLDLHRVQRVHCRQKRSRAKDLAALYFSAMNQGLTKRDCFRFILHYMNISTLKQLTRNQWAFWHSIEKRAFHLYGRLHEKGA